MLRSNLLERRRRMVVIHHTHLIDDIVSLLKRGDIVFFDDCLFSQYVFFKKHWKILQDLDIHSVFGLSPGLVRKSGDGIFNVKSDVLHDFSNRMSRGENVDMDFINGFMSVDEILELNSMENVFFALHGYLHIDIKMISGLIDQMKVFKDELERGRKGFSDILGYDSDIYVFPYAFEPFYARKILINNGYIHQFAGNLTRRIQIEDLENEHRRRKDTFGQHPS